MAFSPSKPLIPQLLDRVLPLTFEYVNTPAKIPSRSIRQMMTFDKRSVQSGFLNVPFYWATYYHNGRGPVRPQAKTFLAYYRDPKDDPRYRQGYPIIPSQLKSLKDVISKEKFKEDRESGKLILTKGVGATQKNYPFFSDSATGGMRGLDKHLGEKLLPETDKYIRDRLSAAGILNKTVKITI